MPTRPSSASIPPDVLTQSPKPAGPTSTVKTPLESLLNADQTSRLINYLDARIQSVDASLGNFREKRRRFQRQMLDDFEWRRGGRERGVYSQAALDEWAQSIFDVQNDSFNIVGGFAAFMSARIIDDVFGTDPFYAVTPEGIEDNDLAEEIQKHSEWKLRKSTWRDAALDSIDYAVAIGEGIIKSTWARDVDVFETRSTVLVNKKGKPVVTVDGDYITQDDVTQGIGTDPTTQQPIPALMVKKDPSLVLRPQDVSWSEMDIEQTNVSFDNVKSAVMDFGDILIPENATSLEESNFVGHRFQKRLSEILAKYPNMDKDLQSILKTENADAKSAEAKPIEELHEVGEHEALQDNPDPIIELVECWIKYDPVGDGRIRRMMILYVRNHRRIITMDYIANITPEGQLPFEVVRAYKVKNRWYGRGYYEIYEKAQEFIDRHLNYVAYRNRFHSNPVTFFDPGNLLEDEETGEFELVPGKSYRLKPGLKVADVLQVFEFPDLDERTWQLMQMMIQVVQVRSGITSAAQGEVSSLPSTSTATGIESILQSASTLARQPMNTVKDGLEKSLLYVIKLIYANMNVQEVYSYFEGDQQKVGMLSPDLVKNLDMNVRILLTRFKQRENVEAAEKAITLVTTQYLPLSESEKGPIRPLFIQVVKGLGFDQADVIVRKPIQQTGGAPIPRENINLNIKFELLPPDIQQQFYPLMGLQPSANPTAGVPPQHQLPPPSPSAPPGSPAVPAGGAMPRPEPRGHPNDVPPDLQNP